MLQFNNNLVANTPIELVTNGVVPKSRASHQFDFSGATGSVQIELDAYTGYRLLTTIDLTKTDREPYVVLCEAKSFRVTPTVNTTIGYCTSII